MKTLRRGLLLTWLFTFPLLAYPDGPFPRLTGGFGEDTCTMCHSGFELNEGRTLGGDLRIAGIPASYKAGEMYPLRVVIAQPGQSRWGFELSARFLASGHQAGELVPLDENCQIKDSRGVQFIEHTEPGTRAGINNGPVEFLFNWVAPATGAEPVLFNASGNAANNDGGTGGDYIYTASAYSGTDAPLPVAAGPQPEPPTRPGYADDSRVVHMTAPVDLEKGQFQFIVQHRFLGSVKRGASAFGIDFGANINLGIDYAVTDRLSLGVARARFDRLMSLGGTYEVLTDPDSPLKFALRGGVDGTDNFRDHYSPFLELATEFDVGRLRTYVVPIVVFNSRPDELAQSIRPLIVEPDSNHTFALGLGADLALSRRFSLVGEYVPRLAGYGGIGGERAATSGGIKIRTWGHVFHLLFSNSRVMTPSTYAVNSTSNDVMFGFNIYRRVPR